MTERVKNIDMSTFLNILGRIFNAITPLVLLFVVFTFNAVKKNEQQIALLQQFAEQGPRFTESDALKLKLELIQMIMGQESRYIDKIDQMNKEITEIRLLLAQHFGVERKTTTPGGS